MTSDLQLPFNPLEMSGYNSAYPKLCNETFAFITPLDLMEGTLSQ